MCYICENKNSAGEPALCKNWEFNSVALLYKKSWNILCFICEDNTFWQQEIILPHMKQFSSILPSGNMLWTLSGFKNVYMLFGWWEEKKKNTSITYMCTCVL